MWLAWVARRLGKPPSVIWPKPPGVQQNLIPSTDCLPQDGQSIVVFYLHRSARCYMWKPLMLAGSQRMEERSKVECAANAFGID